MFNSQRSTFNSGGLFGSSNTNSMFGNKPTNSLFNTSTNSTGFGTNNTSGFNSSSNVFGSSGVKSSTNVFGNSNTTGFGTNNSSTFGAFSNKSTGLFGQTPSNTNTFSSGNSGGLFGSSSGTFGSHAVQNGTGSVKFNPLTGSDVFYKNKTPVTINTRHQCISAMKEYESKSLEELRIDDYLAGRKGGNNNSSFGTSASTSSSGFQFGQNTNQASTGLFNTNKTMFGNTNNTTGNSLFSSSTNNNLFGKSTATTSSNFSFNNTSNTNNTNMFGSKPGGLFSNTATTTNSLFGTTNTTTNSGFSFNTNNTSNLFSKPSTGFGTTTTTSSGFGGGFSGFNTTTSKPSGGLFSGTTGGFGSNTTGGGLFGSKPGGFSAGNTTGTTGGLFGNTNTNTANKGLFSGGFGSNTPAASGNLFGQSNTNTNNQAGSTGFNFNTTSTLGGSNLFNQSTTNNLNTVDALVLPSDRANQTADLLQALISKPFGDSPLFKQSIENLGSKQKQMLRPTNPAAIKAAAQSPIYRVQPDQTYRLRPKARTSFSSANQSSLKPLFPGLQSQDDDPLATTFLPRSSVRKLNVKVTASPSYLTKSPFSPAQQQKMADDLKKTKSAPCGGDISSNLKSTSPQISSPNQKSASCDDSITDLNIHHEKKPSLKTPSPPPPSTTARDANDVSLVKDTREDTLVEAEYIGNHPAGIQFNGSDDGYFTIPSVHDLAHQTDNHGRCVVENFTVGRQGYGSIFFEGQVDVTGIDFDSVVQISSKEACVYPNDDLKPPQGQGLNRPAEITLLNVWPVDKSSRLPVTDVDRLKKMSWHSKLQQITANMNATFIKYQPQTGTWTFKVMHFSKYGLADGDDEVEVDEVVAKQLVDSKKKQPVPAGLWSKDEMIVEAEMDVRRPLKDQDITFTSPPPITIDKLEDIKSSLFADEMGDMETTPTSLLFDSVSISNQFPYAEFQLEKSSPPPLPTKQASSIHLSINPAESKDVEQSSPLIFRRTPRAKPKFRVVSRPVRSITAPSVDLLPMTFRSNACLTLSRSFRIGWGPRWSLARPTTTAVDPQTPSIDLQQLSTSSPPFGVDLQQISAASLLSRDQSCLPYLDFALENSDVISSTCDLLPSISNTSMTSSLSKMASTNASPLPVVRPLHDNEIVASYAHLAKEEWTTVDVAHPESVTSRLRLLTFTLCETLWGKLDDDSSVHQPITIEENRKWKLIGWLIDSIKADKVSRIKSSDDVIGSSSDVITFNLLVEGNLAEAVNSAIKAGNGRLAILLSQALGNVTYRMAINKQLAEWENMKIDLHISDVIIKIYLLLAGRPKWNCNRGVINTCDGLDWKRSLLLHLLFISPSTSSLDDAIKLYDEAWQGTGQYGVYCTAPLPFYEENQSSGTSSEGNSPFKDICYHLIKLYCDRSQQLDKVLTTSSSRPHALDHRVSWHVWRLLVASGYNSHLTTNQLVALHVAYSSQLEAVGLWARALFVIMHIVDNNEREMRVRSMIGRNIEKLFSPENIFITQRLCVPTKWIHEARALDAKSRGDHLFLSQQLLLANHWRFGHDVIMRNLASRYLIDDRCDELKKLLSTMSPPDVSRLIPDWSVAGKIFLDYFSLRERMNALQRGHVTRQQFDDEADVFESDVTSLCQRVILLKCRNPRDRLAKADIAKGVFYLHMSLNTIKSDNEEAVREKYRNLMSSVENLQRLHLPEDLALQGLVQLTNTHLMTFY